MIKEQRDGLISRKCKTSKKIKVKEEINAHLERHVDVIKEEVLIAKKILRDPNLS